MRSLWLSPLLLSVACATGGEVQDPSPTRHPETTMNERPWQGPAITCRANEDGGVQVVLTAPTAGHTFALDRVERDGDTATVWLEHESPQQAFVAQVITPLAVEVAADELGSCRQLVLWVRSDAGEPCLVSRSAR